MQIEDPKHVETQCDNRGRNHQQRINDTDDADDPEQRQPDLQHVYHAGGQQLVDLPHILREPIQDSARRVGVEKPHRSPGDAVEHVVVEVAGRAHAHREERQRPYESDHDGCYRD